jgi:GNAT superfamily N-acetyltransferase
MALGHVEPVDPAVLEAEWRTAVAALGEDRALLVAVRDGAIVGTAQVVRSGAANARHRAEVQRVAVALDARGRGVGRALLGAVDDAARGLGVTLLWLTTHADTDACRFYAEAGYTELGVMPRYSARPDGSLSPGAFFYRELDDGVTARRP